MLTGFVIGFDPVTVVYVITMGYTFFENSLSVLLHFSGILWIDSFIIFFKEFFSITMVTMEIRKRQFFSYHSNGCYGEKSFIKTLNLIDLDDQ